MRNWLLRWKWFCDQKSFAVHAPTVRVFLLKQSANYAVWQFIIFFNIYFKPPRDAVVHFNAMALLSICSTVCLETAKHTSSKVRHHLPEHQKMFFTPNTRQNVGMKKSLISTNLWQYLENSTHTVILRTQLIRRIKHFHCRWPWVTLGHFHEWNHFQGQCLKEYSIYHSQSQVQRTQVMQRSVG